jgi:hypothetical protein
MVADFEAEAGSEAALPLIERHRALLPAEADILLATLRSRQGQVEEAATAIESALVRLRTDPWPLLRYKGKALTLADSIAQSNPALARRMFDALREPFAVRELEDARKLLVADLTRRLDFANICGEAVDAFGTHVPWNARFLDLRRDCFKATGDYRLTAAERDVARFVAGEARPIGQGVPIPAR